MLTLNTPNLSLNAIAASGQCFRWTPMENGCRIVAHGRVLHARQVGPEKLALDCGAAEKALWRDYFDLDTDYAAIIGAIPPEDAYLRAAAEYGQGIRILRQDPWEVLITFILSQRKSIPAIRQAVERLCAAAGEEIGSEEVMPLYAFPSPEALARLNDTALQRCGLGYRAPYVHRTACAFAEGRLTAAGLETLPDDDLFSALCGLYGVGRKIAHCVLLFGFHRMNAFPVDVWMQRVGAAHYPGGIPLAEYAPWAGVMQQYMFAYERHLNGKG